MKKLGVSKSALFWIFFFLAFFIIGCETRTKITETGGPTIKEAWEEPYFGPKARIAVDCFKNKTGKGLMTGDIGEGMSDMLATSLFNTNRFIVLERERIKTILAEQDLAQAGRIIEGKTAVPSGQIEGVELFIAGAVTEFEPSSGGFGGGVIGGNLISIVGGAIGSFRKAHVAIDIRIYDSRTSRILAATSVEASAKDFDAKGFLLGRYAGGDLGIWAKTPMEKAVRNAIKHAVSFIVVNTPKEYFHYRTEVSKTDTAK